MVEPKINRKDVAGKIIKITDVSKKEILLKILSSFYRIDHIIKSNYKVHNCIRTLITVDIAECKKYTYLERYKKNYEDYGYEFVTDIQLINRLEHMEDIW